MYEKETLLVTKHGGTVAMVLAASMKKKDFDRVLGTCLAQASECARPNKREGLFQRLLEPGIGPGAGPDYYIFRQGHILKLQEESQEIYQDISYIHDFLGEARQALQTIKTKPKPSSDDDIDAYFEALTEEVNAEKEVKKWERILGNAQNMFAAKENEFMTFTYGGKPVETEPFNVSSLGVKIPLHVSGKGSWAVNLLPNQLDGSGHALAIYTTSSRDDYMLYDPDWALLIFPTPAKIGAYLQEYLALRGGGGVAQCVIAKVS